MKKLQLIFIPAMLVVLLSFSSCKKSFIDIPPKGSFALDDYYKDQSQAFAALVSVYDILHKNAGGFENMVTFMNAASDDNYAGGGGSTDGVGIHSFANFTINADNIPGSYWGDFYQGIFRANSLLEKIDNTQMDDALKQRYIAETKALRAYYYFNLVILFKNIPLILEPLTLTNLYEVKQTTSDLIYAQIEKDLTEAIAVLPATVNASSDGGRFTAGGAKALLGKVYLYEDKKELAAGQFADVNGTPGGVSQYGYQLLPNFKDLWVFSNKFNSESIIEAVHTNQGNTDWSFWGTGADEGNSVCQMVGPRSYTRKTDNAPDIYVGGWSFNPFTQNFYDFIKNDPRFAATVFDMKAIAAAGDATYIEGDQNTGYFVKKFLPSPADKTTGGGVVELNFQQDSYIIRLADTYLMEAEALGATGTRAQALLDAVRRRVGLASVPVSLQAIKDERRRELAAEGFRFFDLVRWGDAATVLASFGFKPGKNEILPIPASELRGTQLVQNPGY